MSASHGTHSARATGTAGGSPPVPVEDPVRIRCTAEEQCVPSVCTGGERSPTPMRRRWGAARRGALCARCSRLVSQVSLRASRHARTHEHLLHHTAWTACSPHVLAGRSNAVELLHNGFLWLYKSWTVRSDGGASRGAMVCLALLHVSTESDRQIDLS